MKKQIKSLQEGIVLLESKNNRNLTRKEHKLLFELYAILDGVKKSKWQQVVRFVVRLLELIAAISLAIIHVR